MSRSSQRHQRFPEPSPLKPRTQPRERTMAVARLPSTALTRHRWIVVDGRRRYRGQPKRGRIPQEVEDATSARLAAVELQRASEMLARSAMGGFDDITRQSTKNAAVAKIELAWRAVHELVRRHRSGGTTQARRRKPGDTATLGKPKDLTLHARHLANAARLAELALIVDVGDLIYCPPPNTGKQIGRIDEREEMTWGADIVRTPKLDPKRLDSFRAELARRSLDLEDAGPFYHRVVPL